MAEADVAKTIPEVVADSDGLAFACRLNGDGGGATIGWRDVETWSPENGDLWVHLDRASPNTIDWLSKLTDIPDVARKALLADETRPRVFFADNGIIAVLRGINLNAGSDPQDMVAVRIWVDRHRVISVRQRRLQSPRDTLADITERHIGPKSAPELFVKLAERLTERMNSVVIKMDEQLDTIEARLEEDESSSLRRELTDIRQTCVGLRRYIGPQREALARLQIEHPEWLEKEQQINLHENADRLQRYLEDLDAARERAVVIRDEIANRLTESMNRTMYALSVVAGVFLPLGFLTGLLGINVGGMPGVESGYAFWATCIMLGLVLVGEVLLFRRLKWI